MSLDDTNLTFVWTAVVSHKQYLHLSSMPNRDTFSVGLIYFLMIIECVPWDIDIVL